MYSTLQLFRAEGLGIFALGAIYLSRKGLKTPSHLNKSLVRPMIERPRANIPRPSALKSCKVELTNSNFNFVVNKFFCEMATAHKLEVKSFGARPRNGAICEESIAPALLTTNKAHQTDGHSPNDFTSSL